MDLYEFQAKRIFEENMIPIPRGRWVKTAREAEEVCKELGGPVAIKAQVLVGGRGLAGGVKFAENPEETRKAASQILGGSVKGEKTWILLVEEKIKASRELYAGVTYDFRRKCPIVVASSCGGVDVETVAKEHPQDIATKLVDPFKGFNPYLGRELATEIGLQGNESVQYANIIQALWRIFEQHDAELVEANPLAVAQDRLISLDAKLRIDDKSIFRQGDLLKKIPHPSMDLSEGFESRLLQARQMKIPTYIEMPGNIGVIADGAGTGMLTLDLVEDDGGKTGVYCEMGGEATAELIENAMRAALSVDGTRVALINLIGGLNRMDEMAKGIVSYVQKYRMKTPLVVRMSGTMEEEGQRILGTEGVEAHGDLYKAVEEAVRLSR